MFVTHNPKPYVYDTPDKYGWNHIPSLLKKNGADVIGIGKYELHKFLSVYLKFKPDIIIAEWIPASLIPIFFKKLRIVKCPVVLNWGDYYADMMIKYPHSIINFLENWAAKNADYIVTASNYNRSKAIKFKKKVFTVYPGYFPGKKYTSMNLSKLKVTKGPVLVYLGDQGKFKRVDRIIEAVKGKECDLFLVGTINPEMVKIAEKSKNIHFMGQVDESEVRPVLSQADIVVNTSDQDCNYKLFEYISIGKPILAYDGRVSYLLRHNENAYLTKDFKKAIDELINDKSLIKKIEINIKKFKVYTWLETGKIYIDTFNKIIDENKI